MAPNETGFLQLTHEEAAHPKGMVEETNSQAGKRSRQEKKATFWALLILALLFWDDVIGILLHTLDLALEYLELAVETLIEAVFHVESHEAQMYTAWTGLFAFTLLLTQSYLWIRRKIRRTFRSRAYFRSWLKIHLQENWLPITLVTIVWLSWNLLL